jgi:outer membrane protein
MIERRAIGASFMLACLLPLTIDKAAGADLSDNGGAVPSVYIVELGGYGVFEPTFEGSSRYQMGFKPIFDFYKVGDRVWLSFPNDAFTFDLYETANFHTGVAGDISLQSRHHDNDIDLRLGRSDVNLRAGAFAEYYPIDAVRTRIEVLQAVSGSDGLVATLSADYIWRPDAAWTLTLGPRLAFVDDAYASNYFSTRAGLSDSNVRFKAAGGFHAAGAELTGNYDWTSKISTKFYMDYSRLAGDAADSPRVDLRGSADQYAIGLGLSYKLSIQR